MPAFALSSAAAADEKVRELQARIREMQSTRLTTKSLATSPLLAGLLPDGMLKAGAAYAISGSTTLAMAMLAAPSAAGAWCGVVGVPEFGAQAAVGHGIDLDRLVLVPSPGDQWLAVAAAIVDVLTVVVLRPSGRVSDGDAGRLAARLRKREAALITLGDWPGAEARLTLGRSEWEGIGTGHGLLRRRRVEVHVDSHGRRTRSAWVALPDGVPVPPAAVPADDIVERGAWLGPQPPVPTRRDSDVAAERWGRARATQVAELPHALPSTRAG
ncbi:MAG: hypothetical protein JWP66_1616 [Naasia sp.]|nr:hypothetical protein [Naasia sp.]